jgi:hypothetical protein
MNMKRNVSSSLRVLKGQKMVVVVKWNDDELFTVII